jgi:hypothetical protein
MPFIAALVIGAQLPSSQQVYDDMQAALGKAKAVSFRFSRVKADAWESEAEVSIRRPNYAQSFSSGNSWQSDGSWIYERGTAGTYLLKLPPVRRRPLHAGFESLFEPPVRPKIVGECTETTVDWLPNKKLWKIGLSFSDTPVAYNLFVDPATKLPVGFSLSSGGSYYYRDVTLYEHVSGKAPSLAPPSLYEVLSNSRKAMAGYKSVKFSLRRDLKETGERFEITRGGLYRYRVFNPRGKVTKQVSNASRKRVWNIRELFGLEALTGESSRIKYLGQPEFTALDSYDAEPAWAVKGRVPGSSKEIRIYYSRATWLPIGYDLLAQGQPTRTVIYHDLSLSDLR